MLCGLLTPDSGRGTALGYDIRIGKHLAFGTMAVPSRALGDHLAENICLLAILAATCGKIGREIYTLMKTEFGEVGSRCPPGTTKSEEIKRHVGYMTHEWYLRAHLGAERDDVLVELGLRFCGMVDEPTSSTRQLAGRHARREQCSSPRQNWRHEIADKIDTWDLTRYGRQQTWSATFVASPISDGLRSANGMLSPVTLPRSADIDADIACGTDRRGVDFR
jgi:hypothetical protein